MPCRHFNLANFSQKMNVIRLHDIFGQGAYRRTLVNIKLIKMCSSPTIYLCKTAFEFQRLLLAAKATLN